MLELAAAVQALACPNRRAIVEELGNGDRPVAELTRKLRISQSAVSCHLRLLRQAGLAGNQPVGARYLYRLRSDRADAVCGYTQRMREDATGTGWPPPTRAGHGAGRDRAAAARIRHAVLPHRAFGLWISCTDLRWPPAHCAPARLINRWHLFGEPTGDGVPAAGSVSPRSLDPWGPASRMNHSAAWPVFSMRSPSPGGGITARPAPGETITQGSSRCPRRAHRLRG